MGLEVNAFVLYVFIASMPLASVIAKRIVGVKRVTLFSLLLLVPMILELYSFATCHVYWLVEWFWMNCGSSLIERIIVSLTLPTFVIPLFSLVLALIGIKEEKDSLLVLSSIVVLSLAFYWSNYLTLVGSMLAKPPKLPPLGYGTLRSFFFFLYLPLLTISGALAIGYLATGRRVYGRFASVLAFLSLSLAAFWGLYGFGVPIPSTSYHVALIFFALSTLYLYVKPSKLGALTLFVAFIDAFVLPRLYPSGYGGMPSPFFGVQTSVALALLVTAAVATFYSFKRDWPKWNKYELPLFLLILASTAVAFYDFSYNLIVKVSRKVEWYDYVVTMASLAIIAVYVALVPYIKSKDKVATSSLIGFLHPYLSVIMSIAIPIYLAAKKKRYYDALIALSALTFAYALVYGSALSLLTPYATTLNNVLKVKDVSSKLYTYEGNHTAYNYVREFLISNGKRNETLRTRLYMTIYMNKYLPPNAGIYFQWGIPKWDFLEACTIGLRSMMNRPVAAAFCVPLAAYAIIAPILVALTVLVRRRQ
ncbi:hypothetical protein IPA_08305 [Ignicoccus pacificus DSM 13166]|uniref:Uncharacterized protein n=1 Tax=Ignicoccus pacificus DSM 13166 TaxID=940294 RepID=A0A977KCY5_9CREN|nr:hypothetical protein IPA_08305 [Ignicoccus pacificus DSM 13166]